jgi:hypothetical protein
VGDKSLRVEFELTSSGFKRHAHQGPKLCDVIVCWEHDAWHWDPWLHDKTAHIKIVELKRILEENAHWLFLSPESIEAERESRLERILEKVGQTPFSQAAELYRELHKGLRKISHLSYSISSEMAERVQVSWWDIYLYWHRPVEFLIVYFNQGWLRLRFPTDGRDINLRESKEISDALVKIGQSIERMRNVANLQDGT